MSNSHYLPPHALDEWVIAASELLGITPDTGTTKTILNLARDVAHDVARPAAPVTAFLLGLAVARSETQDAALHELSQKLVDLAASWEPTSGTSSSD